VTLDLAHELAPRKAREATTSPEPERAVALSAAEGGRSG
jgi:hypothetical protein